MRDHARIVVPTCDKYLPALRIFLRQLRKYYQPTPEVIVGGFSEPDFDLGPGVEFMSLGRMEDYPVARWSEQLAAILTAIPDDVVHIALEDYWLTRPVNVEAVDILYRYMLQFEYVAKIDLCTDRLYAYGADLNYDTVSYLDLIKSMPGSPYHLSLYWGLWRKEHLLRNIEPGWTPWDVEINGTQHLSHDQNVIVLGTRNYPLRLCLGLRGGDSSAIVAEGMKPEDMAELRELGYLKAWEK